MVYRVLGLVIALLGSAGLHGLQARGAQDRDGPDWPWWRGTQRNGVSPAHGFDPAALKKALSGEPRTANVVTEEPTTLLSVPAPVLRGWMDKRTLRHLFLSTAAERLGRTNDADWPRLAGLDQEALRELREQGGVER